MSDQSRVPRVSVLVAAYNSAQTIRATVDSALAQRYPNLEVVVVDDGSTDETPSLLKSYGNRIVVVSKQNGGVATSRNTAMRAASGDLFALLDGDDLCMPERVAVQVAALTADSDIALCSTEFSAFNADGPVAPRYSPTYYSALGRIEGGFRHLLPETRMVMADGGTFRVQVGHAFPEILFGNFLHPPTVMFPRSTWAAVGDFDESLRNQCDWHWIARAAKAGRVAFVETPLLDYRLSPSQMTNEANRVKRTPDTIRHVRKVWEIDPETSQRFDARRRVFMAEMLMEGADAMADDDRSLARRYFRESLAERFNLNGDTLRVGAKLLVPRFAIRALRRLRGRAPDGQLKQE